MRQVLLFGNGQWCIGLANTEYIGLGLTNPGADAAFVKLKLLGKFIGLTLKTYLLDHLLGELGRIRR